VQGGRARPKSTRARPSPCTSEFKARHTLQGCNSIGVRLHQFACRASAGQGMGWGADFITLNIDHPPPQALQLLRWLHGYTDSARYRQHTSGRPEQSLYLPTLCSPAWDSSLHI